MKTKISLIMASAMLITATAFGQPQGPPPSRDGERPDRAKDMTERMTKDLSLSDEQAGKVLTLIQNMDADRKAEMEANREQQEEEREARMQAGKERMERFDTQMKEILTADQYATWQENMKKEHEKGRSSSDKGRKGGKRGNTSPSAPAEETGK